MYWRALPVQMPMSWVPLLHYVCIYRQDGNRINIVAFIPETVQESESWTARGEVSMLKEELKDWCEPVQRIVEG